MSQTFKFSTHEGISFAFTLSETSRWSGIAFGCYWFWRVLERLLCLFIAYHGPIAPTKTAGMMEPILEQEQLQTKKQNAAFSAPAFEKTCCLEGRVGADPPEK